ncbi:MAG: WG repeat-containing protein, partial [Bacteroidota bacterium]
LNLPDDALSGVELIFPFQGDLAIFNEGRKYGIFYLSATGEYDKLEANYDYIDILAPNKIQVQFGKNNIRYTIENHRFKEELILEGRTVSKNKVPAYFPAKVIQSSPLKDSEPQFHQTSTLGLTLERQKSGTQILRTIEVTSGPNIGTQKNIPCAFIKDSLNYLKAHELSAGVLGVHKKQVVDKPSDFEKRALAWKAAPIDLFHRGTKKVHSIPHLIGLRKFDVRFPYTAFLKADGRMGLVNQQGEILEKDGRVVEYTFISYFQDGKAAACKGGKLVLSENNQEVKGIEVMDKKTFTEEFHIYPLQRKRRDKTINHRLYLVASPDNPIEWVYINEKGEEVIAINADFAYPFNEQNQTAQIEVLVEVENSIGQKFKRKRKGLINGHGAALLSPEYNQIKAYRDYFVVAKSGTPTISFTEKGRQIKKNPTRLRPFSDELSVFRSTEGKWGFLNKQGEEIIAPIYSWARPFSEDRALIRDEKGEYIFINKKGENVFGTGFFGQNQWRGIGDFKNGRCWFKAEGRSLKWGCYDLEGNIVIEPQFYYKPTHQMDVEKVQQLPMDFSKGVAAVQVFQAKGAIKAAVIDTSGQFIVPPGKFTQINRFDQKGYATFSDAREKGWGIIDHQAKVIAPPKYQTIGSFIDGYARVKSTNNKWGLIDHHGKEVIPTKYVMIDTLSEGLVGVQLPNNKWQFLNKSNQVAIKGPFENIKAFQNGITLVEHDGKQIIINNKGEMIRLKQGKPIFFSKGIIGVEVQKKKKYYYADASGQNLFGRYFREIHPFEKNSAKVKAFSETYTSKRYYGAVNTKGVTVVPPKFNTLHFQTDGTIIVNPQIYKGIVNKHGKVVLPIAYDQVLPVAPYDRSGREMGQIFRVEDGEKIGYVRLIDDQIEWIWKLQN